MCSWLWHPTPKQRWSCPNQDPYEVPTLKHWRIIHTYMARLQSYYINSWVTKEIQRQWSVRVLNIAEAKPKYYHSTIKGPASALRCEVLGCCSRGRLQVSSQTSGSPLGHTHLPQQSQNPGISAHNWKTQAKPEQLKLSKTDPSTWP
jgi:hypothetical protein